MKFKFSCVSIIFLLLFLVANIYWLVNSTSNDFYYWVKPGVYFLYEYTYHASRSFFLRINSTWYCTHIHNKLFYVNYTIISVQDSSMLVNVELIFPEAAECGTGLKPDITMILERNASLTRLVFNTALRIDLKTLATYIGDKWLIEWPFLATREQLLGEVPKVFREILKCYPEKCTHGIFYIDPNNSHLIERAELFRHIIFERLGERIDIFSVLLYYYDELNKMYTLDLKTNRFYVLYYINIQPPSNFTLTINNYTISGDRIASIDTSVTKIFKRNFTERELRILELELNITNDILVLRHKYFPLEIYATRPLDEPNAPYSCIAYDFSNNEFYALGIPQACISIAVVKPEFKAYYDAFTGILLHSNDYNVILLTLDLLEKLVDEILPASKVEEYLGEIVFERFASVTLIDTNVNFERTVLGGVEPEIIQIPHLVACIVGIIIIVVLFTLLRRRRTSSH